MTLALPRTTWVPGVGPRPDDEWLRAIDADLLVGVGTLLFDRAQGFEAHEAWELAWRTAKNENRVDEERVLRALIKLAAAMVKVRQQVLAGVREHGRGARALLQEHGGGAILGVDVFAAAAIAHRVENATADDLAREAAWPVGAPMPLFGKLPRAS